MSDKPWFPSKPKLLGPEATKALQIAAHENAKLVRAARFAQMIEHILVQPVRRFHRKPPVVISPQVADVFSDDEDD